MDKNEYTKKNAEMRLSMEFGMVNYLRDARNEALKAGDYEVADAMGKAYDATWKMLMTWMDADRELLHQYEASRSL